MAFATSKLLFTQWFWMLYTFSFTCKFWVILSKYIQELIMPSEDKMLAVYIYLIMFFGLNTTEKQSPLSLTVPHSLPPSMHSSYPEKCELDHSNVSKLFSTHRRKSWPCSIFLWLWTSLLPTQTFKNHRLSAWFFGTHLLFGTNIGRPRRTRRVFCRQSYQTCFVSWFSNWQLHFNSQQGEHSRDLLFVRYTEV